jgi:hypothetical protein
MVTFIRFVALWAAAAGMGLSGCSGPSCNSPAGGPGTPAIRLTHVPPRGSVDTLRGAVQHVKPADYYVAVFIQVPGSGGWWTKPTFAEPRTQVHCNGGFSADITTGANDSEATQIAAFLLPNNADPPALAGNATLPPSLYKSAAAVVLVSR